MAASMAGGRGHGAVLAGARRREIPRPATPPSGCRARWSTRSPTSCAATAGRPALILALIAVYRISDVVMGIMANPFYVDMGYTKDEVAAVTKVYGVVMTLVGAFVGGVLAMRLGVMRVLMLGAVLSAASNLLFAWLGSRGHDVTALVLVVSADNLAGGIASAAFIAYLSSLTNVELLGDAVRAVQLHDAVAAEVAGRLLGRYVDAYGYSNFFTATALLGVPVLLLVWLASRTPPTELRSGVRAPGLIGHDRRGPLPATGTLFRVYIQFCCFLLPFSRHSVASKPTRKRPCRLESPLFKSPPTRRRPPSVSARKRWPTRLRNRAAACVPTTSATRRCPPG
jgi:MFS family permease